MSGMQLVHVPRPEDDPEHKNPNVAGEKIPRATQRLRAAERRVRVAVLLLQQVPQREIARREHVGLGTIGDDVRAIKAMWAERTAEAYAQRVAEEDAKLDALEKVWIEKALSGDSGAMFHCKWLFERRAKLLGFDKPTKIDATLTLDVEEERARGLRLVQAVESTRDTG